MQISVIMRCHLSLVQIFIFLCFWVWQCMMISLKQRRIKFQLRIKLNHSKYKCRFIVTVWFLSKKATIPRLLYVPFLSGHAMTVLFFEYSGVSFFFVEEYYNNNFFVWCNLFRQAKGGRASTPVHHSWSCTRWCRSCKAICARYLTTVY